MAGGNSHLRQKILVVEDEQFVRMLAVDVVEDAGYEVIQAANADEAITALESCVDIGVVFSDIEMPGSLNGMKLAHCIRKRWPPIEIILTSGRSFPQGNELPSRVTFLSKPYQLSKLVEMVTEMVA